MVETISESDTGAGPGLIGPASRRKRHVSLSEGRDYGGVTEGGESMGTTNRRAGPVTAPVPGTREERIAEALRRLAPRLPAFEARAALDRALLSPGLRNAMPATAARLALTAYARHVFTDYDDLLAEGYDRDSARHFVLDDLNAALAGWGAPPVSGEAEDD